LVVRPFGFPAVGVDTIVILSLGCQHRRQQENDMDNFPPWADTAERKTEYLLRVAAVRVRQGGTLYTLSRAVGRNRNYFSTIVARGRRVPAEDAAAIERLAGIPREAFSPEVFAGMTRAE
jgi:hypothetical protein